LPNLEYVFFSLEEIYPNLVSFRIDSRKRLEFTFWMHCCSWYMLPKLYTSGC